MKLRCQGVRIECKFLDKQGISDNTANKVQKAGAIAYSKGKVAVNWISKKGKEIAVI